MSNESLLSNIPANQNPLQQHKFVFVIAQLPTCSYFCNAVTMPSVSTNPVLQPGPALDVWRHGDRLVYEPISITFEIDEDLRNWEEAYKWMYGVTDPSISRQINTYEKQKQKKLYYDGILEVNKNSNVANFRVKFANLSPVSLTGFDFTVQNGGMVLTPQASLTMQYDYFTIERFE
jgi:hypothetical protein